MRRAASSIDDRARGRLSAGDRVVDAFADQPLGHARRIADEQDPFVRRAVCLAADTDGITDHLFHPIGSRDASRICCEVLLGEDRTIALAVKADIEMIALREYPAVAAGHAAEVQSHRRAIRARHSALQRKRSGWWLAADQFAHATVRTVGTDKISAAELFAGVEHDADIACARFDARNIADLLKARPVL